MALQYVGGKAVNITASTSTATTVALTDLSGGLAASPAAGDIVVVAFAVGATANVSTTISIGAGDYTYIHKVYSGVSSTYDTNLNIAYKVLTEADASVNVSPTGSTSNAGVVIVHVWRGVDSTTPIDATRTPGTFSSTGVMAGVSFGAITPVTSGAVVIPVAACAGGTAGVFGIVSQSNSITAVNTVGVDTVCGIGSTAWTGGSYKPENWTGGATTTSVSWISTSFALRPALAVAQTLNPSLVTNDQTFYSTTVSPGAVGLSPSLLANTQTFYGPTAAGAVGLSPAQLANSQAFYGPTVGRGAVALAASRLSNSQAFYAPTVGGGPVSLAASLVSNAQSFKAPTVGVGAIALQPSLTTNYQSFYQAQVTTGSTSLQPSRLQNEQTFYAHNLTGGGAFTVSPALLANAQSFLQASVIPGPVAVAPSLSASAATVYPPSVGSGAVTLSAPQIQSATALFAPAVTQTAITLRPPAIGPSSSVQAPGVSAGPVSLAAPWLASSSTVYTPTTAAYNALTPPALESLTSFFQASVSSSSASVKPPLLVANGTIFAPRIGDRFSDIYRLLANRQELDPVTGKFRVYDDDGTTVFMEADAWEDAAGTVRFRGLGLARIDRLMPYVQ